MHSDDMRQNIITKDDVGQHIITVLLVFIEMREVRLNKIKRSHCTV